MENAAPLARAFDMSMEQLGSTIATFSDVGIGAQDTIDKLSEAGLASNALGLSGKKIIGEIQSNIGRLNEYGFKNGVQGLTRMVQKANEFKVSFEMTAKLADKVFNPEGALDMVANLQALGGAVGNLNDPLKLMYMATNDIEGLQDALIGASSGLAHYNEEQQKFEIKGASLRIAKEQADILGQSWEDYSKTIMKTAERQRSMSALMSTGLSLKPEDKEFITNIASMENGQMVIKLPQNIADELKLKPTQALSSLGQDTIDKLKSMRDEIEKQTTATTAEKQLTELGMIRNLIQSIAQGVGISLGNKALGTAKFFGGGVSENAKKFLNDRQLENKDANYAQMKKDYAKNPLIAAKNDAVKEFNKNFNRDKYNLDEGKKEIDYEKMTKAISDGTHQAMTSYNLNKKPQSFAYVYSQEDNSSYLNPY